MWNIIAEAGLGLAIIIGVPLGFLYLYLRPSSCELPHAKKPTEWPEDWG